MDRLLETGTEALEISGCGADHGRVDSLHCVGGRLDGQDTEEAAREVEIANTRVLGSDLEAKRYRPIRRQVIARPRSDLHENGLRSLTRHPP